MTRRSIDGLVPYKGAHDLPAVPSTASQRHVPSQAQKNVGRSLGGCHAWGPLSFIHA